MKECPHCKGTEGVVFSDYGVINTYYQPFGGVELREIIDTRHTTKAPVYGKCIDCGKRIKLKNIINQ